MESHNLSHGPFEPDFGTTTAGVLKKQRKIRGGRGAHVKKLLTRVEDSIANFKPSLQDKLSQQKIILWEKLDTLKTLDSKILELVNDENEDESLEHDVEAKSRMKSGGLWFVSI